MRKIRGSTAQQTDVHPGLRSDEKTGYRGAVRIFIFSVVLFVLCVLCKEILLIGVEQ